MADSFARRQKEEMKRLRRFKPGVIAGCILAVCCGMALLTLAYFGVSTTPQDLSKLHQSRKLLAQAQDPNAHRILALQQAYQTWLKDHGINIEYQAFARVSLIVLGPAASTVSSRNGGPSAEIGSFSTTCSLAIMRICFLLLSCWRFWVLIMVAAAGWSFLQYKPYLGDDLLGQTGNGRHYYSGIRAALENLAPDGAPDKHVRGLACPNWLPEADTRQSALGELLEDQEVDNDTNIELAGIILFHEKWPAFIPKSEDEREFRASIQPISLVDATTAIVESVLKLAQHYRSNPSGAVEQYMMGRPTAANPSNFSLEQLMPLLQQSFHRVLPPDGRRVIAEADPALIVTTILGYQAGKVMAYAYEGERWIRKSNFSQLTARAILHSAPSYGKDYDYDSRNLIRRSLIYGSRSSVFGPVRFLRDLAPLSRALRQWIEVLMSCPHELESCSDEIELFGLVCEQRALWMEAIYTALPEEALKEGSRIYATDTNLVLAPVGTIMSIVRRCINLGALARIKELVALVSKRQQEFQAQQVQTDTDTLNAGIPSYERVFPPLKPELIEQLVSEQGLEKQDVEDWTAMRVILNSHGWLARRVGDYSVPESSIIFAILRGCAKDQNPNELGLVGQAGMIPIRASRFEERWGRDWSRRFIYARASNMAETREHYEKLMKGISDDVVDEHDPVALVNG